MLNAALPRAGIPIPEAKGLFKPETANQTPFFWTVTPPVFFLGKENGGVWSCRPQAAYPSALCAENIVFLLSQEPYFSSGLSFASISIAIV